MTLANEDESMLTKKHLCGLSCATCDKNLTDIQGKQVQFLPWNKLPHRNTGERIAKVGQGFSKMLSSLDQTYHSSSHQDVKSHRKSQPHTTTMAGTTHVHDSDAQ